MDAPHFDALARRLGSRRTALGGLFAGLLLSLEAAARGKQGKQRKGKVRGKGKGKDKSKKDKKRANAQAEPCWRAGACIPKKGANVSRCDLSFTFFPSDSTGSNLSRANLRGVNAQFVNFTKANLSGACLVDADFTGATFTNNTNLYNAIFCRTTMPDGSVNNSGCGNATTCCPTCIETGNACGVGIGGNCCGGGSCLNGICQPCPCTGIGQVCNAQGACICAPGWKLLPDGQCGYPCVDGVEDCGPVGCPRCFSNLGVCFSDDSNFCIEGSCPAGQFCAVAFCLTLCGPPVGGPVAT